MKKKAIVTFIFLLSISIGNAQKIKYVSVAVISETIAIPFTRYTPYHPGAEIKATFKVKEKSKSIRQISACLGGYFHRRVETGIYIGGEYIHTFKIKNTVGIDIPAGLGYLHTFYPGELYKQNQETGEFEKVVQFGRPHVFVNLGIGISYIKNPNIRPFIRQELLVETPFANGIPVITHSFVKLGISIKINRNE